MTDDCRQDAAARTPPIGHVAALVVLAGWLVGVHLAHPALLDPDEPRSAIVARLMVERGDWLAPHLPAVFHHDYPHDPPEGDLFAYWDKPPLYFWLSAAAMKMLGPTAVAARLPASLAHILTVLAVYAAAWTLWGKRAGLLSGIVMALSPLPLVMAHVARMDTMLSALMAVMLLAVLRVQHQTCRPWLWPYVFWVAAGLGLMTKGPEAVVLPAAAVGLTVVLTGRWRNLRRLRPVTGLAVCLVIAAPWYVYMALRYPAATDGSSEGFLYEFFVRQHFSRAASAEFGHAAEPPGYLLGVLLIGLMPWTVFLPGACARLVRDGWRGRRERPAVVLLLVWAALIVGVFSISMTQLAHYILPAFPPLAILVGVYLADRLDAGGADRWFRAGLATTVALGAAGLVAFVVYLVRTGLWEWHCVITIGGFTAITAAGGACFVRRRHAAAVAVLIAGLVVAMTYFFTADPFRIYILYSTRAETRALEKHLGPGDAVIAYPRTPYSFAWYLWPRDVPYPGEAGPGAGEPSLGGLVEQLNQPRRTFCILQKRTLVNLLRPKVRWPIRIVLQAPRHTLIVTEPPQAEKADER